MLTCLFETASAVGTVGLSLGITPELNLLSRGVLILLMFFGRVGGLIISVSEGLPMLPCLFETASAVGTVGLSLGITPELNLLSRSVLILLMFFGRVGGLTLIFAALSSAQKKVSKLPKEKITVG